MSKDNYAAYVNQNMPSLDAQYSHILNKSAHLQRTCHAIELDLIKDEAYFNLRFDRGIGYGKAEANTAHSEGAGIGPRWRSQSKPTGRSRSIIPGQSVLRSQGSRPGSLRDGPPPSGRRPTDQRCSQHLRGLEAHFLQGPNRTCRPRSGRLGSQSSRPQGRPQNLRRSHCLCRRAQGDDARSHRAAIRGRDRHAFWHQRASTKSRASTGAQKKTKRNAISSDGINIVDLYERLRAAVISAQLNPAAGLATLRRQGMLAWMRGTHAVAMPDLVAPRRVHFTPGGAATPSNELTLILASLVVTLTAEHTHA